MRNSSDHNPPPANAAGQPLPHIVRTRAHTAYFNGEGLTVGGWVQLEDGRIGVVHTYPGGDEQGIVSVGIDGASQFGSDGERVMVSIYKLRSIDFPDMADLDAVEEWLDR